VSERTTPLVPNLHPLLAQVTTVLLLFARHLEKKRHQKKHVTYLKKRSRNSLQKKKSVLHERNLHKPRI
jgi:hypothetical protein